MKSPYLRRRARETEDPLEHALEGLLGVFLCGMGAAAALVIIYSVLPKLGSAVGGENLAGSTPRIATVTPPTRRMKQHLTGSELLIVVLEAAPSSPLQPDAIRLEGAATPVQRWLERSPDGGWRLGFRLCEAQLPEQLSLRYATAGQPAPGPGTLAVGLCLNGFTYHLTAAFLPDDARSGQVATAGVFWLRDFVAGQTASPGLEAARSVAAPGDAITVLNFYPGSGRAVVSGALD